MRQTVLQFFFSFQMGDRFICILLSIISNLITPVRLWLGANTRELISFASSRCNGFIPEDLITVRCPVCV